MPLDRNEYSVTNLKNIDDLSSNSRIGVSNSATRPAKLSKQVSWAKNMCAFPPTLNPNQKQKTEAMEKSGSGN